MRFVTEDRYANFGVIRPRDHELTGEGVDTVSVLLYWAYRGHGDRTAKYRRCQGVVRGDAVKVASSGIGFRETEVRERRDIAANDDREAAARNCCCASGAGIGSREIIRANVADRWAASDRDTQVDSRSRGENRRGAGDVGQGNRSVEYFADSIRAVVISNSNRRSVVRHVEGFGPADKTRRGSNERWAELRVGENILGLFRGIRVEAAEHGRRGRTYGR